MNQLAPIYLTAEINRKDNDVTGLGKIAKTAKTLSRDQVQGIRDLARYNSGVYAAEQGSGATAGYAMRGVDKNRVSISVDGIPQAQSFLDPSYYNTDLTSRGSGARNEIEFENVSGIEIAKGGNSADSGSGALGGSVNFTTKNVNDVLLPNKSFGASVKSAYSSKNSQYMGSFAAAFQKNGFEGLIQYTHRKGKETRPHRSVSDEEFSINPVGYYINKYDLREGRSENTLNDAFYRSDCSMNCDPMYKAKVKTYNKLISQNEMNLLREQYRALMQNNLDTEEGKAKYRSYKENALRQLPRYAQFLNGPNPALKERVEQIIKRAVDIAILDSKNDASYIENEISKSIGKLGYTLDVAGKEIELGRALTPEETAQYLSMVNKSEMVSAEDYTGPERGYPDPLQKETKSWLGRLGYHFNDAHYIGWIFEDTTQSYNTRDMTTRAYYLFSEFKEKEPSAGQDASGYYIHNPFEGAYAPAKWSRAHFVDELHHKQRHGLSYIYNGGSALVDRFELNLDWQKVTLNTDDMLLGCAEYPNVDKHCRATQNKPGSWHELFLSKYVETHRRIGLKYGKVLNFWGMEHNIQITAGIDHSKARFDKINSKLYWKTRYASSQVGGMTYIKFLPSEKNTEQSTECQNLTGNDNCNGVTFVGKNRYVSLRDNFTLTKYVDVGVGARYDVNTLELPQTLEEKNLGVVTKWNIPKKRYETLSWNAGIVVKPFEFMDIAYRVSTGFRVPSFVEYFGDNSTNQPSLSERNLEPEKALNKELGITFKSSWGYLEGSYYTTSYRGLIGQAQVKGSNIESYHNYSDVSISGINIQGMIDLNAVWRKIPEGFSMNASYARAKSKNVSAAPDLKGVLYPLDAIQPPRTVIGLNYDDPDQKWGLRTVMVHSRAKSIDEIYYRNERYIANNNIKGTKAQSESWITWDLIGYLNLPHNISINAGIYNVFNRRYSEWEVIRQSSYGALHRHNPQTTSGVDGNAATNLARYTAPGRNFTLGFEMKF